MADAQAAQEGPERSNPGRLGLRGGMLMVVFHLLSLFHSLVCPAGQEKAAAAGCPQLASPRAGLVGHVGSVEDLRASPESGNASLFSLPSSAARTLKVILRPLKQKRRLARH